MDFSAIWISLKTASVSMVFTFILGLLAAFWVLRLHNTRVATIMDGVFTLPLVLPPTVAGFFLLYLFGVQRPLGTFLLDFFGVQLVFNWPSTVLAAVLVSFPLMYRSAKSALEQVDENVLAAARTIGFSEVLVFFKIALPLASPGIVSGAILAFARALGEFGATILIAGNIAGQTRTLPLAVYSAISSGDTQTALHYVLILVAISFLAVLGMNFLQRKSRPWLAKEPLE